MRQEKIERLRQNLDILIQIKNTVAVDEIHAKKTNEWILRYGLFESIQIMIDLSCNIVSALNLGSPKSYSECIKLLVQNGYIQPALGKDLRQMAALRNLLVHEYGIIEVDKLYSYLDNLPAFDTFINAIADLPE